MGGEGRVDGTDVGAAVAQVAVVVVGHDGRLVGRRDVRGDLGHLGKDPLDHLLARLVTQVGHQQLPQVPDRAAQDQAVVVHLVDHVVGPDVVRCHVADAAAVLVEVGRHRRVAGLQEGHGVRVGLAHVAVPVPDAPDDRVHVKAVAVLVVDHVGQHGRVVAAQSGSQEGQVAVEPGVAVLVVVHVHRDRLVHPVHVVDQVVGVVADVGVEAVGVQLGLGVLAVGAPGEHVPVAHPCEVGAQVVACQVVHIGVRAADRQGCVGGVTAGAEHAVLVREGVPVVGGDAEVRGG